jgi:hypothetical protein
VSRIIRVFLRFLLLLVFLGLFLRVIWVIRHIRFVMVIFSVMRVFRAKRVIRAEIVVSRLLPCLLQVLLIKKRENARATGHAAEVSTALEADQ